MDKALGQGCEGEHADDSWPICRGEELDPDFLAMIEKAASQPGRVMTADEAIEWLRTHL